MRACGDCTACCITFSIADLNKPAHVPCAHADGGCGIYPHRPPPCRAYRCGWIDGGSVFTEDERPDLVGMISDTPTGIPSIPLVLREIREGDADSDTAKAMMQRLATTRLLLLVRRDGTKTLHGPDDLVAAARYLLP
jgi:hypothetical protein